tara:strand:- start:400 stop:1110 length:711 start_codon:yes stop_codon:yes gene_type:complete
MVTNRFHVREFNNYLGELHAAMGKGVDAADVVKHEASMILARASELTERAKMPDIEKRYTIKRSSKKNKQGGSRVVQNPEAVPFITMRGKKYSTSNYYPKKIWNEMQKKLEFYKKRAKARVFSGKASWLLMAKKARLSTKKFKSKESLNKAIRTQAAGFKKNSTENGTRIPGMFKFRIRIFNNSVAALNKSARGHFAIKSAMGGRQGFFRNNMKMGVFKKAKRIGKKYPGVRVATA